MSEKFHKLNEDRKFIDMFKWPRFFTIFFTSAIFIMVITFILGILLSDPAYIIQYDPPNDVSGLLNALLIIVPMLFIWFFMIPIIGKKYYENKNNVVLYLFGMFIFIGLGSFMGVFLEFFNFGSAILVKYMNQSVFIVIMTAMYFYYMFDQEVFHGGFDKLDVKWKVFTLVFYALPTSAIVFRVLELDLYPTAVENIFLGLPTVVLVFYTLFDIIFQSFKISGILDESQYRFKVAYRFIALSSIVLIVFFIVFAAFIVLGEDQDNVIFYINLGLLSIVVFFLYLGYIWPVRVQNKKENEDEEE